MGHLRSSVAGFGVALLIVACGSEAPGGPGGDLAASGGATNGIGGVGAARNSGGAFAGVGGGLGGSSGLLGGSGTSGGAAGMGGGAGAFVAGGGAPSATGGAAAEGGGGMAVASGGAAGGTNVGGSAMGGAGGTAAGGGAPIARPALVTSGEGSYWQEEQLTTTGGGNATVTVEVNTTFQKWIGFGGTFNEAGWDALAQLPPAEIERALRLLFDAKEGANFAWGRIPIGASDYAMSRYTLNDTAGDYEMASFSIARDKEKLIPFIKAALKVKPNVRLWASPWSPPAWMKDSNNIDGTDAGESFVSHMLSDPKTLQAYALYFARFIEEYKAEGIHVEHVQPQNEPGYKTRYPSCLWEDGLLGTFVGEYLGPTLKSRNLDTQIWFGTLSNDITYAGQISGLAAAGTYAVGVGLQWNTMPGAQKLANQGYLVMQTEHRCGNYPWLTDTFNPNKPPNDHSYAVESWGLIRDWIKAGVHGYSAWNMVLDTVGKNLDAMRPWPQNALLTVDRGAKILAATPTYYVFRHLSYFVDPDALRVGTTGGDALAFKNPDGSIVTILHNAGGAAAQTTLSVGGTSVQFQIPARGWATVNWGG